MGTHVYSLGIYHPLKAKRFKWAFVKAFGNQAPSSGGFLSLCLVPSVSLPLRPALMLVLFPHLVEDKVKDQLEAAKPEPIIDEVVRIFRTRSVPAVPICIQA